MKFETSVHVTLIGTAWRIDSFHDGMHSTMDISNIPEDARNRITDALMAAIKMPGAVQIGHKKGWDQ